MKVVQLDDLIGYNKLVCNLSGERSAIINEDNLLSALSVQYGYFESDKLIASALFRSLIIGHGFADGNKRTATMCLLDMLPPTVDDGVIESVAIKIAIGELKNPEEIANKLFK